MRFNELESNQPEIGDILEVEMGDEIVETVIVGITNGVYIVETDSDSGMALLESRSDWDSNMPGYKGDYGGAENWGRRNKASDENEKIDAQIRAQHEQKKQYEVSGKFWLKKKDTQEHISDEFIGKAAANKAALELLKQQPELKGNLLITAYGPGEVREAKQRLDPKCWDGYKKQGTKMKGGVRVNNCVKEELNEFAPGSSGGESGRWYTDDQMIDLVGDGWYEDMDVSGNIPKQQMIQQAQDWLDDQGYSVQVLNAKLNDDDMDWFIQGSFHNPGFAKKGVAEAGNKPLEKSRFGTGDTRTPRDIKSQMQGASDEFVKSTADSKTGPLHSRVAKMQGKLAKSELRRRGQGVAEGKYDRDDYYNARQGREYGKGLTATGYGGNDSQTRRDDIFKGQSKRLPADPFNRTKGSVPMSKTGRVHKIAQPDEMEEGYTVTRGIDRERYQERQGLEGPFSTKSGKVVYYDKAEGKYYDPDTDMYIEYSDWQAMNEAEYQGRPVKLGKPTQGDVKKFKVYVRNPATGKTIKVNFGDPNMTIKKSNPKRRKSFRARHNCSNPGPRTKARYWSCRKW